MISPMVVLAPHGEVANALPVVRLATHKLLVSIDAVDSRQKTDDRGQMTVNRRQKKEDRKQKTLSSKQKTLDSGQ